MAVPETKAPGPAPRPVAPGNGVGQPPAAAAPGGSGADKPGFKLSGIFGGRKRKDGLPPGSGAAAVADTEAERIRKAAYRASKKQHESPPTLPAPLAKPGQPIAPAGNSTSPVPGSAPVNGVAQVPGQPGEVVTPIVLWSAPDLIELTDTAVPLVEEILHSAKLNKLRASKVKPEQIKEIERDFNWPAKGKTMLSKSSAALGAKYLNKVGVNAAYKDEVNFGMALLIILKAEASTNSRLDRLIAAAEKAAVPTASSAPASNAPAAPVSAGVPGSGLPVTPPSLFPTDIAPGGTTNKK